MVVRVRGETRARAGVRIIVGCTVRRSWVTVRGEAVDTSWSIDLGKVLGEQGQGWLPMEGTGGVSRAQWAVLLGLGEVGRYQGCGADIKELASTRPDPVLPGESGLVGMVSTDLRQGKNSLRAGPLAGADLELGGRGQTGRGHSGLGTGGARGMDTGLRWGLLVGGDSHGSDHF